MVDSFQEALGQRLVDLSEHIKRLRKDFYEKDDAKLLEKKVVQNKNVILETNKKIKELELNIKKIITFTNTLKNSSANMEEIHLIHTRQDALIKEFAEFKKTVDKNINYNYNDILGVFRKFKDALLTKEKKDVKHLEIIFKKFSAAYADFKKKTTDYELKTDIRLNDMKTKLEKELNSNFIAFKSDVTTAVKELKTKEEADQIKLVNDLKNTKVQIDTNLATFEKKTENYLFNLDKEIETYIGKIRKELKALDASAAHKNSLLEKRFTDIKVNLMSTLKQNNSEIEKLRHELIIEKQKSGKELQDFKLEFQSEFDHLSANLSNLNDVQIKLVREEVITHIDKVSDKFNDTAKHNYHELKDELLHQAVNYDKMIRKLEVRLDRAEKKLLPKVVKKKSK